MSGSLRSLRVSHAEDGVRPTCRGCWKPSEQLDPVMPAVEAGPLRLFSCPHCRRRTFRMRRPSFAR